jgi:hypothetical protein
MAHAGNPRRAARGGNAPAHGAELVSALSFLASKFTRAAHLEKRRLLAALATTPVGDAAHLVRLHETLCFLQAYPDDRELLDRVDGLLRELPTRIRALGRRAQARLRDTGIAGSTHEYPYGLPMSLWLAARLGPSVDIGWDGVEDQEKTAEALDLLVTPSESDAFSEGGFTVRRWLDVARAGRRLTDLQVLIEAFDRAPLDAGMRDWLFDSLGLPVRATFGVPRLSRTGAKRPVERVAFQRSALRRSGIHLARETVRPLSGMRRASPPLAAELIETARAAMATRSGAHASHLNAEDVLVVTRSRPPWRADRARARVPAAVRGVLRVLAIRNGVPVGYGAAAPRDARVRVKSRVPQGNHSIPARCFVPTIVFRMRTVAVDPYQLGADNLEALRSGAFYFYRHLGFEPRDAAVRRVLAEETRKIARDRRYRSSLAILRRLARDEASLTLPGGSPEPERRLRARDLAALVTRDVARRHGGDREAATRDAVRRVTQALGVRTLSGWSNAERRAFRQWALVVTLVPDLERWPDASRGRLVRMIRAKGGRGEGPYVRGLLSLTRLHRALQALVRAAPRGAPGGRP